MFGEGFLTSRLEEALGWARKYLDLSMPVRDGLLGWSMATACAHYDVDRFGAGLPRFSPRQADVLFVVGTISHKMAPVLKRIYDQMAEPKWVVSFGVCTCTGGFYDNYATVMGIDTIILWTPTSRAVRRGPVRARRPAQARPKSRPSTPPASDLLPTSESEVA